MSRCLVLVCLSCFLLLSGTGRCADITVPDDYPTIQDAIDAAATGDTVLVRAGIWQENIDFSGKAITVKSLFGPDQTVLNGMKSGSVVTFSGAEGPGSILEGFQISNGLGYYVSSFYGHSGGGILCLGSSPTIRDNIISLNAARKGGGICCLDESAPAISRNTIIENSANHGGGIYCRNSSPTIIGNTVSNNEADQGGGICSQKSSTPLIANNTLASNTAQLDGGGMWAAIPTDYFVINNTVFGNTALQYGGGCFSSGQGNCSVINSIFWNNDAAKGPEIYVDLSSSVSASFSDIEGGENSVFVKLGGSFHWGTGMYKVDPHFVEPQAGDFHLVALSLCKDSGDNGSVPPEVTEDIEGDPRIVDNNVDMGADEFHAHIYHTGPVVPGTKMSFRVIGNPGSSVILAEGSGLFDPPLPTLFGNCHIRPPFVRYSLPAIPFHGISLVRIDVPSSWISGEKHPFQAYLSDPGILTNLMLVEVE